MSKLLDRKAKSFILLIADVFGVVASAFFAYILMTISHRAPIEIDLPILLWVGANVVLALVLFTVLGMYRMVLSSVSVLDGLRICAAVGIQAVLNVVFALAVGMPEELGIGLFLVTGFSAFLMCYAAVSRFLKRVVLTFRRLYAKNKTADKRVMVIGGGDAGATLVKEMLYSEKINYKPVCVLDDNTALHGNHIQNVSVVGSTSEVQQFAEKYGVEEIFIALPSVSAERRKEIAQKCSETGLPIRMLPGLYQLANGQVSVSSLRSVDVRDLLGREQVAVNLDEIMGYIENQTVLVTGGGGSIGSELCRQIATHNPKQLIILDIYENNAYDVEQELRRKHPDLKLLVLIASVRDKRKIEDVFDKYRPDIVFNAAAHKHVPLMETSPNEAVKNNVFGTLNVAKAADKYQAKVFVQISTDKAVNPTNIMGATKRICEMIVQTIGRNSKKTKFVAVRFGNVLGSNGSVIPLFKKQIEEGGPVTVTHKDIVRYFMTIPEAVSLVLQAGAYAQGGQIFVLDMGEPVKIYDLACNLIRLSGLKPEVDIKIECTGLRPGEKLFEERLMEEEGLQRTENGLINIARPIDLDEEKLWKSLDVIYAQVCEEADEVKETVKTLVPTYTIDKRESVAAAFLKEAAVSKDVV